ncbi:hypothetical protein CAEBREN_12994 [Caenorhabditis brenneri]|uniref:Uncharacterized protein n=1 Tax=Caenorhabditis brenneri TaxID=135651 RepID=G0MRG5_CAEBE|nr:hypothetical protein CAEBREN_12994 [Caenorhabditis brenneri]
MFSQLKSLKCTLSGNDLEERKKIFDETVEDNETLDVVECRQENPRLENTPFRRRCNDKKSRNLEEMRRRMEEVRQVPVSPMR